MQALKTVSNVPLSTIAKTLRNFSVAQDKSLGQAPTSWQKPNTADLSKLRIYQQRSTVDLLNLLVMNTVCTKDIFVDNCHHLFDVSNKLIGSRLTNAVIGNTMGRIFTAGDSLQAVEKFVKNWNQKNINLYIDYSNEAVPGQILTNEDLNDTTRVFCETISIASKAGEKSGIAIKVSALCLPEVLLKANIAQVNIYSIFSRGFANLNETLTGEEILRNFHELKMEVSFSDFREFLSLFLNKKLSSEAELSQVKVTKFEWLNNLHAYYIKDAKKNSNKVLLQLTKLSQSDLEGLEQLNQRLDAVFKKADEEKCTVLADAEQTYIQATIDSFTMQYSEVYNKSTPIILNTFQNYLKTTKDRVIFEIERSKALNLPFGAKLVRGAYMIEERRLAKELNYPDPIHDNIEETHDCYNANLTTVIKNWIPNSHLMVASHNEYSNYLGKNLVKEYGITSDKGHVSFVQLLGLADYVTYANADEGLTSAKYCPFGPIPIMVPYLIRRAQESKQMLASASLQRKLVVSELVNRIKRS